MSKSIVRLLVLAVLSVFTVSAAARAQSAQALIRETAKTMGGIAALRAIKNQVVESEGKQFDSSSTPRPLGPTRQISTFRSSLTRDLTQPRLRLEWESRNSARGETIRFVEVIDGSAGLLQEGEAKTAKQTRLHPGRLVTRLREEKRAPVNLILAATANKTLQRLADAELDGVKYQVVSFKDGDDKFRVYLDPKSHLPAQTEILEDDPLEGDSSYLLRYADWRKVDQIVMPFSLRYELNGRALQEEQIKSVQNNVAFVTDPFNVPQAIRTGKTDVTPIASQWILRRVAGNVSYQDLGRPPSIEWTQLANGVHKIGGSSHATIVVEMRDHLIAVEGPLYEARTAPVVKAIKERFPGKPIRYVIPTHHHLDHSGGIRAFMAEGAIVVSPFSARDFYSRVAKAPHTRQTRQPGKSSNAGRNRILRRRSARADGRRPACRDLSPADVSRRRSGRRLSSGRKDRHRSGSYQPAQRPSPGCARSQGIGRRPRPTESRCHHDCRHTRRQRAHPSGARRCPRRSALGPSSSLELNPVKEGMNLCETKHLLSQA